MPRYLCILERVSGIWLSFPAVCSMVQSKVMRKSCHLLSFWLSSVRCMKVTRGVWSVRITKLSPFNWASKKCRLSIIANNSFLKVGYLNCIGLNWQLWKQDGLIASRVHCAICNPSPTSLVSHMRYFASLDPLFQCLKTYGEFTSSFSLLNPWSWVSVQFHLMYSPCSSDRVLMSEARPGRNRCKYFTSPRNSRMSFLRVGVGNSSIVFLFLGSTCNLSEVTICLRMYNLLAKNWHLLSFK